MSVPLSELAKLGHASADDLLACRALLKTGSRSFHAAGKLLPQALHQQAGALYAFCRLADDDIDDADPAAKDAALAGLRHRLDCAYAGRPLPHPVDRAFADVVERHSMPRALPEALLEGFAWDAAGRRYETISEVMDYGARVAGAVGAMMSVLMNRRLPATMARACDLGVAMQLSNIARDVGEDARAGRLYLPMAWMREEGIDPDAFLANPVFSDALGRVVARLLFVAEGLYARADAGIAGLPLSCRPGIYTARMLYSEIGEEVLRRGGDSVGSRAVVSGRRKLGLLGQSVVMAVMPRRADASPPLAETRFLVEAVQHAGEPRPMISRLGWTVELFARLDERDRQTGLRAAAR
jgi:phytoene synthase